jgi:folate-binding protein YgfZ
VAGDVNRDVLAVRGGDAVGYLQGQLSQDVAALEVGDSAFALLLQPQGKIDAWLRVTRTGDEEFVLDVDAGWGEHVRARLQRFLLRVQVTLEPLDWSVGVLEGEDAPVPAGAWRVRSEVPGTTTVLGPRPGVSGDLEGEAYEVRRIEHGIPRMGRELDESTIPAASGIVDRSVSFTKGCYTGQELVARIDARGDRVPTRLRRLRGAVVAGEPIVIDGREVGRVTSAAGGVGLGYVRREVEPPADAVVAGEPVVVEAIAAG